MHSSLNLINLRAHAERERRQRKAQSHGTFAAWLPTVSPELTWNWPHTAAIRAQLDRITSGDVKRLMLFVPPRHGKSELATIHYPAYRLESDPTQRVVIAAYNATLAEKFSRRVRGIVRRRNLALDPERQAVNDWMTTKGGGCRAVGVGGGITGQGGNLIIIDDPVKNREEADSPAYREKVWSWYTDDLYTRREPDAAMVLIMTRWHEDDLAGRILNSEQAKDWTVIDYPAIALENDPLGRSVGAALCPDRYDETALLDIKQTLGTRGWQALYQQRPAPPEGAMFKRHWFAIVPASNPLARRVRYWDLAAAETGKGDYTAGGLLAMDASRRYAIEDMQHFQLAPYERNQRIIQQAHLDRDRFGQVEIVIEQPPGIAKEASDAVIRELAGFAVYADKVHADKISRAEPFAAQCAAGNVSIVAGAWNTALLDELTSFPYGEHDDQIDTLSGGFNHLTARMVSVAASHPFGSYRG